MEGREAEVRETVGAGAGAELIGESWVEGGAAERKP